jgi:hypothetical protein
MAIKQDNKQHLNNAPYNSTNSNTSIASLFEARKKFSELTLPFVNTEIVYSNGYNIPFGDIYNDNALCGVIDDENDVCIPDQKKYELKNIDINYTNSIQPKLLYDFCIEAFSKMKDYLAFEKLCGNIPDNSVYNNLFIEKSFSDMENFYDVHNNSLAFFFRDLILKVKDLNSSIKNHKNFVAEYIKFLTTRATVDSITFSEFVLFLNIKSFSSGFMFSLSDKDDPGNDYIKFDKYYTDEGFPVFVEACKRFGFKIDKNIPWILYADIKSPAMIGTYGNYQGFLTKQGILNINDFFKKRFIKTYKLDFELMKEFFYNSYVTFLSNGNEYYNESDSKLCSVESRQQTVYIREKVTKEKFFSDFPNTFWIRLYVFFRNIETKKNLTQVQFENIVREANKYVKNNKIEEGMKYINEFFKDFSQVKYFSSLQPKSSMLEDKASNVQLNNVIF